MNHTSSHHLSAKKSGLLLSQSALVCWLEEHVWLLFPAASESEGAKRGKPPTLTLAHLCLALFVGVFCGATGFTDIWRWLVTEPLGGFPKLTITDDAVRKAIGRWGPQTFANLYIHLCDALPRIKISQTTTGLATFATEIVALDESTGVSYPSAPQTSSPPRSRRSWPACRQDCRAMGCPSTTLVSPAIPR